MPLPIVTDPFKIRQPQSAFDLVLEDAVGVEGQV